MSDQARELRMWQLSKNFGEFEVVRRGPKPDRVPGPTIRKFLRVQLEGNREGELERLVTMYLDYAENQAARQIPMKMAAWVAKLEACLQFNEYQVLTSAGNISAEVAKRLAKEQYAQFPGAAGPRVRKRLRGRGQTHRVEAHKVAEAPRRVKAPLRFLHHVGNAAAVGPELSRIGRAALL